MTSVPVVPPGPLFEGCRVYVIQIAPDEYRPELDSNGHDAVLWAIGEAMDGRQRRSLRVVRKRIENGPSGVPWELAYFSLLSLCYCPWGVLWVLPKVGGYQLVRWRDGIYERDSRGVLTLTDTIVWRDPKPGEVI